MAENNNYDIDPAALNYGNAALYGVDTDIADETPGVKRGLDRISKLLMQGTRKAVGSSKSPMGVARAYLDSIVSGKGFGTAYSAELASQQKAQGDPLKAMDRMIKLMQLESLEKKRGATWGPVTLDKKTGKYYTKNSVTGKKDWVPGQTEKATWGKKYYDKDLGWVQKSTAGQIRQLKEEDEGDIPGKGRAIALANIREKIGGYIAADKEVPPRLIRQHDAIANKIEHIVAGESTVQKPYGKSYAEYFGVRGQGKLPEKGKLKRVPLDMKPKDIREMKTELGGQIEGYKQVREALKNIMGSVVGPTGFASRIAETISAAKANILQIPADQLDEPALQFQAAIKWITAQNWRKVVGTGQISKADFEFLDETIKSPGFWTTENEIKNGLNKLSGILSKVMQPNLEALYGDTMKDLTGGTIIKLGQEIRFGNGDIGIYVGGDPKDGSSWIQ